jgi:hypothetical protein
MEFHITMKKIILALALALAPSLAFGQCNGVFPANTLCGNLSASPAPPAAFSASGTVVGPGSSVVNDIATYANTGGTQIKDSGVLISNVPLLGSNNTYTGTNTFNNTVSGTGVTSLFASPPAIGGTAAAAGSFTTLSSSGNAVFGSGKPWIDITSGAQGCTAADPTAVSDSTMAIQCYLNYMNSTFGGGIVFVPPGQYLVSAGGVTVKGGVQIHGTGVSGSIIKTNTDSKVITFDSATCNKGTALENTWIQGFQSAAATQDAVTIGANCPVILRDNYIWGGKSGLTTAGVDGRYTNNFICGASASGANVNSTGANFYTDDKIDTCGFTVSVGFSQGVACCSLGVAENHFTNTDFSGAFTDSVAINDGGGATALTTFTGGIFSGPIVITAAKASMFSAAEFGSTMLSVNGPINIVGSFAFSPTTVTGGTRSCAGNTNITC